MHDGGEGGAGLEEASGVRLRMWFAALLPILGFIPLPSQSADVAREEERGSLLSFESHTFAR